MRRDFPFPLQAQATRIWISAVLRSRSLAAIYSPKAFSRQPRLELHEAGRAPTKDNLTVFYLPDTETWREGVTRMRAAGFEPVPSFNPYWDVNGRTFEDPDGYRIVLQNAAWP
ncbi:VOC family protein [Pseudooceanicola sp. HF7]|uniref:VOC family protein n=1 Tax=Pseudooceanicola sp. HF7 TaxID=2721560 RepID=UPI0034C5D4AD